MIVDKDANPEETIYYIACCVLEIIKRKDYIDLDQLHRDISTNFNINLAYNNFISALDFLYLIEKLKIKNDRITCL